jgi:glycerol kinase
VLQADIAQLPVQRPAFQETTSLGAALAAGLAAGVYTYDDMFDKGTGERVDVFQPKLSSAQAQVKCASWRVAVEKSFGQSDLD